MATIFDKTHDDEIVEIEEGEDFSLLEYLSDVKTGSERYSVRQVAIALDKAGGFITYAAKLLRCSVGTVRRYIRNYPQLADLVKDIDDFRLDTSEVELFKKIQKGDNTAIIFHLKCKGKKRGYIDNAAINYNVGVDPERANWKEMMDEVADHLEGNPDECLVPETPEDGGSEPS